MGAQRRWRSRSLLSCTAAWTLAACSNVVGDERERPESARTTEAANRDAVDSLFDAGVGSATAAVLLDDTAAVRGIACGVALPVLCAAEQEKCCVRSLAVDVCLGRDVACGCEFADCEVMEVRCDGPEDCSDGQACCGTLTRDGSDATGYSSFACASACRPEQNQRVACHAGAHACPGDLICTESQFLTNMHVCVDAASLVQ